MKAHEEFNTTSVSSGAATSVSFRVVMVTSSHSMYVCIGAFLWVHCGASHVARVANPSLHNPQLTTITLFHTFVLDMVVVVSRESWH